MLALTALLGIGQPSYAGTPACPILANLTFEQLSEITITTASKRPESLATTAAAVTVLHNEDIARSGAGAILDVYSVPPGTNAGNPAHCRCSRGR